MIIPSYKVWNVSEANTSRLRRGLSGRGCPRGQSDKFVSHPALLFCEERCLINPSVMAYAVPPPLVRGGLRSVLPVIMQPLQSAPLRQGNQFFKISPFFLLIFNRKNTNLFGKGFPRQVWDRVPIFRRRKLISVAVTR